MTESERRQPPLDEEIDDLIRRESDRALRRFRSGDFSARLKSRLASPAEDVPDRAPASRFFYKLIPRPGLGIFFLAVTVTAAAAVSVFHWIPEARHRRAEAGFQAMTETFRRTDLFTPRAPARAPEAPAAGLSEPEANPFSKILFRFAPSETGRESTTPGVPSSLRPLFSPRERFKILFQDKAIERALILIATQNREV